MMPQTFLISRFQQSFLASCLLEIFLGFRAFDTFDRFTLIQLCSDSLQSIFLRFMCWRFRMSDSLDNKVNIVDCMNREDVVVVEDRINYVNVFSTPD